MSEPTALGDDPIKSMKTMHILLANKNPDVVAYAARAGDEHVIREYLHSAPNEVSKGNL